MTKNIDDSVSAPSDFRIFKMAPRDPLTLFWGGTPLGVCAGRPGPGGGRPDSGGRAKDSSCLAADWAGRAKDSSGLAADWAGRAADWAALATDWSGRAADSVGRRPGRAGDGLALAVAAGFGGNAGRHI